MTWHHYNDRLETSLLNMERWAKERGILNMTTTKKKWLRNKKWEVLQYVHFRPLLTLSKDEIISTSHKLHIKSFEDSTNIDSWYTLRNKLRQENKFPNIDYLSLEKKLWKTTLPNIKKLTSPREWVKEYYKIWKIDNISSLQMLLDFMWSYKNISSMFLGEIYSFLQKEKWYKFKDWWYFFRCHWNTYIIKSKEKFRLKAWNIWSNISSKWFTELNKQWDTFRWKRFRKFLINQKIPLFLRSSIPVKKKNWKIVNTLFYKDLKKLNYL